MFLDTSKTDFDPYQGTALIAPVTIKTESEPLKLSVTFLQAADIDAFLALQNIIRPTLRQEHHLKERNAADLRQHLGERMPLIGVETKDGKLVGQCLLAFLKNHDAVKNLNGYPISTQEMPVTAVAQSVCVHPDYQGKGISKLLLNTVFETAAKNGMTQIISAISNDNPESIGSFESRGYTAFACGYDPVKGYQKTYFRRLIGCDAACPRVALNA